MKANLEKLFRIFADVAGFSLVVLMAVTTIDVVARNLGLFSLRGAVELSTTSIVLIGFLALPYSIFAGGHIVVDLVTHRLPKQINEKIDGIWMLLATGCFGLMAFLMWKATHKAFESNDLTMDLQIPVGWLWIFASLGMTLATVACAIVALRKLSLSQQAE